MTLRDRATTFHVDCCLLRDQQVNIYAKNCSPNIYGQVADSLRFTTKFNSI